MNVRRPTQLDRRPQCNLYVCSCSGGGHVLCLTTDDDDQDEDADYDDDAPGFCTISAYWEDGPEKHQPRGRHAELLSGSEEEPEAEIQPDEAPLDLYSNLVNGTPEEHMLILNQPRQIMLLQDITNEPSLDEVFDDFWGSTPQNTGFVTPDQLHMEWLTCCHEGPN